MHNLKKNSPIISKDEKIFQAINKIIKSKIKILFVVDKKNTLLGSISSGDIRRSIGKKININQNVRDIMFKKPEFLYKKETIKPAEEDLICIPIVNKKKQIVDFEYSKVIKKDKKNTVFLMAGGKGKRLMPMTKKNPKPLLKIKGTPIIEKIIINFREQGYKNFIISVKYLGHKIKKYLGSGEKLNVKISYIHEKTFLGTAGSLSLIDINKSTFPIIVTNSDLITEIDYNNLINYHLSKKSDLTICSKNKTFVMPYGEILQHNDKVKSIIEKPVTNHLINAGVYVFNKELVKKIKKSKKLMMNDFIISQLKKNKKITIYPVYENWVDIGNKEDFNIYS